MFLRLLTTLLKWLLSFGLMGGLLIGLFLVHEKMRAELEEEEGEKKTATAPQKERKDFVCLEKDEIERYGLETEAARAVRWYPRVLVYGRVVPNPQATAEVRSPFAGTLRTAAGASWPTLGQQVRAGQALAEVDVRVSPEVRLDLQNKLAAARISQRGAEDEVQIEKDRVNSLQRVTDPGIIARDALDAALIHLAQVKTQLTTAKASVELWQKALEEIDKHTASGAAAWSQRLTAPADGEVTVLSGRLGMSVEAGSPILTLVDFRRPLVRLDMPPEILALGGPPSQVDVQLPASVLPPMSGIVPSRRDAGPTRKSAPANLAGPAPQVEATLQFASYWYEVRLPRAKKGAATSLWRPGMQVTAEVQAAGEQPQRAVAVPASAVLYHQGRPLVYVRIEPDKFQRREVHLLGREGDRWIIALPEGGGPPVGLTPDEVVVSRQAQVLLSKEFLVAGEVEND